MCCLFGILDYGHKLSRKEKTKILSVLSVACEERGTDATGIAYNSGGSLKVYKRPLPAHLLWFKVYENTNLVMGHTRMTTQGSERFNQNNHPFSGQVGCTNFALAHNGVLSNDKRLRRQHDLPATKIETDSYIAVQLLEASGELSFASLASMAEKLEGSFTISVMTDQDDLYLIKGDSPICLYHYEKLNFYIYASTEPILKTALKQLNMKLGKPTKVKLDCGEILHIDAAGNMKKVHLLPAYGHELASAFNQFYAYVSVLDAGDRRDARLTLVDCTRIVLADVLDCLGMGAPEEM